MQSSLVLLQISAALWILTLMVGAADGLYYHLLKLRLHARRESRAEHGAHTLRALLLPPTLIVAFTAAAPEAPSSRVLVLVSLVGLDWLVAIWDVALERKSRESLGGLPHFEYFIHVGATALHSAAEAFMIAAWMMAALTKADVPRAVALSSIVWTLVLVGSASALVHLALLIRPGGGEAPRPARRHGPQGL